MSDLETLKYQRAKISDSFSTLNYFMNSPTYDKDYRELSERSKEIEDQISKLEASLDVPDDGGSDE